LKVFANGGKLAIVGNGGSAAEASHIATEFLSKCLVDHDPLPVLCLNESTTFLTASANDYGFENTLTRLVRAYLKPNDILIGLSTSGKSKNILRGLAAANEIGCYTILWTGDTRSTLECNEIWHVKSNITPRIQEIHLFWGHQLAEITEKKL
jgi:D-sedoheptulose 7-phosphate isomerase